MYSLARQLCALKGDFAEAIEMCLYFNRLDQRVIRVGLSCYMMAQRVFYYMLRRNNMTLFTLSFTLVLILLIVVVTIVLVFIYADKRDKGHFHLHIKLGPLEFIIDTSAEKVIKRVKKD